MSQKLLKQTEREQKLIARMRAEKEFNRRFSKVNEYDRKKVAKIHDLLMHSLDDIKVYVQDPGDNSYYYKVVFVTALGCLKFDSSLISYFPRGWLKGVLSYSTSYRLAEPAEVLENWKRCGHGQVLRAELIEKWLKE